MAISLGNGTQNTANSGTTVLAPAGAGTISVSAGDVVIVCVAINPRTATLTITKNAGTCTINSFAAAVPGNPDLLVKLALYYATVTASGTLQVSVASGSTIVGCLVQVQAYSGAAGVVPSSYIGGDSIDPASIEVTTLWANSWVVGGFVYELTTTTLTALSGIVAEQVNSVTGSDAKGLSGLLGSNETALAVGNADMNVENPDGKTWLSSGFEIVYQFTRAATGHASASAKTEAIQLGAGTTNSASSGTTVLAPSGAGTINVTAGDVVVVAFAVNPNTANLSVAKNAGTATVGTFTAMTDNSNNAYITNGNTKLALYAATVTGSGTLQIVATSDTTIVNAVVMVQDYSGAAGYANPKATATGAAGTSATNTVNTAHINSWGASAFIAISNGAITASSGIISEQTIVSDITGSTNDLTAFYGSNETRSPSSTAQTVTKPSGATWAAIGIELVGNFRELATAAIQGLATRVAGSGKSAAGAASASVALKMSEVRASTGAAQAAASMTIPHQTEAAAGHAQGTATPAVLTNSKGVAGHASGSAGRVASSLKPAAVAVSASASLFASALRQSTPAASARADRITSSLKPAAGHASAAATLVSHTSKAAAGNANAVATPLLPVFFAAAGNASAAATRSISQVVAVAGHAQAQAALKFIAAASHIAAAGVPVASSLVGKAGHAQAAAQVSAASAQVVPPGSIHSTVSMSASSLKSAAGASAGHAAIVASTHKSSAGAMSAHAVAITGGVVAPTVSSMSGRAKASIAFVAHVGISATVHVSLSTNRQAAMRGRATISQTTLVSGRASGTATLLRGAGGRASIGSAARLEPNWALCGDAGGDW